MDKIKQHSDSFIIAAILFFFGGFQNAYTYINCGKVFANLQTGNLVLLAINLTDGNFPLVIRYLVPLSSFWLGCFVGSLVDVKCKQNFKIHWRTIVLFIELVCVIIAGLLPDSFDLASAAVITFNSALSLQGFKTVDKRSLPTTMMIGNMRKAIEYITRYALLHKKEDMKEFRIVFWLLIVFLLGAMVGAKLSKYFYSRTILFLIPLYIVAIIYLQIDKSSI